MSSASDPMASRCTTSRSPTRPLTHIRISRRSPDGRAWLHAEGSRLQRSRHHGIPASLSQADHGRIGQQSAEGLQDVGRPRAPLRRTPRRALWPAGSEHLVLRSLERTRHSLLARHTGRVLQALRLCRGGGSRGAAQCHGWRTGKHRAGQPKGDGVSRQLSQSIA